MSTLLRLLLLFSLLALSVAGCRADSSSALPQAGPDAASLCTSRFVPHTLDFNTQPHSEPIRMFDSNGAGVAVGDLNDDGLPEIVLANLAAPSALFWNLGGVRFQRQDFPIGEAHAVQIVDVDGDNRRDIVFSQRLGAPSWWRNTGNPSASAAAGPVQGFTQTTMPGITAPAYSIAWGDLDQDGDLDLVTGSYDAELEQVLRDSFLFGPGAGVYFYSQEQGQFHAQRLADSAQALSISLFDVNGDDAPDIVVGNDFGMPDQVWLHSTGGELWQPAQPFSATTHSTMSFAAGDVDNNGETELFATDMKPYTDDVNTLAQWQPVTAAMMHEPMTPGDPQIMENVLQVRGKDGVYHNEATTWGIAATGWSWSSQFGDLDNDGLLDLLVVNGMAAEELFGHLPAAELIEENQAFRNTGKRFEPAPDWGLGGRAGGRGMALADLDNDGDLDAVVNNLAASAVLYENQLCAGDALAVTLNWPGSGNTAGLGAQLRLTTSEGTLLRELRSAGGYLTGEPAVAHFGLPAGATLQRLEILWPDGAVSQVSNPTANTHLGVSRNSTVGGKRAKVAATAQPLATRQFTPSADAAIFPAGEMSAGSPAAAYDAAIATSWFDLIYTLIRQEALTPPVASRLLGYAGVTLYEAVAPGIPQAVSLAGQLNELEPLPQPDVQHAYHWPATANAALATVLRTLLAGAGSDSLDAITDLEQRWQREFAAATAPDRLQRSTAQGQLVGLAVFRWAQNDGYAYLNQCAYTAPGKEGQWRPTPPGYAAPLQPCWGQMRPFALRERSNQCQPDTQPVYSEEVGSPFFLEALEVYQTTTELTSEQAEIARFWADDAGKTGTPPGHSVAILTQVVRGEALTLAEAAPLYARLTIALADAFISCWQTKFATQVVRPVTYIQTTMDPAWQPPVATPPFPEYTSGHSVQIGATAAVLQARFGESYTITDHTHAALGYVPRTFTSWQAMAEEAALSRLYGGIHYRSAIEIGLQQGACIGDQVNGLRLTP